MNTTQEVRPKMDGRLSLLLPQDEKALLFKVAAQRRVPVSEFIRCAIRQAANGLTEA